MKYIARLAVFLCLYSLEKNGYVGSLFTQVKSIINGSKSNFLIFYVFCLFIWTNKVIIIFKYPFGMNEKFWFCSLKWVVIRYFVFINIVDIFSLEGSLTLFVVLFFNVLIVRKSW